MARIRPFHTTSWARAWGPRWSSGVPKKGAERSHTVPAASPSEQNVHPSGKHNRDVAEQFWIQSHDGPAVQFSFTHHLLWERRPAVTNEKHRKSNSLWGSDYWSVDFPLIGCGYQKLILKSSSPDNRFLELENGKQGRATSCWVTSCSRRQEVGQQTKVVRKTWRVRDICMLCACMCVLVYNFLRHFTKAHMSCFLEVLLWNKPE